MEMSDVRAARSSCASWFVPSNRRYRFAFVSLKPAGRAASFPGVPHTIECSEIRSR